MDKLTEYQSLVKKILNEVASMREDAPRALKTQRIFDDEHGQYLLYKNDWRGERRIYGCFIHLEISPNAKIWLQHDGTDQLIAQQLLDLGVPKEDIVLGFRAPIVRKDTGFAVA